jgi:hypothetical protein
MPVRNHDVQIRALAIAVLAGLGLFFIPSVQADIGLQVATKAVHAGEVLRGWSNGAGFPVYIVRSAQAPKRYSCHGGTAVCEPRAKRPPGKPFVLLGRVPGAPRLALAGPVGTGGTGNDAAGALSRLTSFCSGSPVKDRAEQTPH